MPIGIPLRNDLVYFDTVVQLDGVTYTLELRWIVRDNAWLMNVRDSQGSDPPLVCGIKLLANSKLIDFNFTERPYPGFFMVLDASNTGADPGLGNLGTIYQLLYFSGAELAAILAGTSVAALVAAAA